MVFRGHLQAIRRKASLCFFGSVTLFLIGLCHPAAALEAGAAKVEITPEPGAPLDGYLYREGRAGVEVHDPLWVRALYLSQGDTELLLVSADLYAISAELRDRVLELVPGDVPDEHVILTATNTHSGPGGLRPSWLARQRSGRFMPESFEQTAQRFAEAMRLAYESRTRGAIGYATTAQDTLTLNRFDPSGPVDPQIGVLRIDDSDGDAIAIVANLSAAAATVSKEFAFAYSADFPGYFCNALEEMTGPTCVAMFLNGSAGDQLPANPETASGWDWPESVGRLLAGRVKALANNIRGMEPRLYVGYAAPSLSRSLTSNFHGRTAPIQTLEIGDLLIAFLPGTPYAEVGLKLRRTARERGYGAAFVVGAANDHLMSFPSKASYSHYDPEFGTTYFGPGMEDWLSDAVSALMRRGDYEASEGVVVESPEIRKLGSGSHARLEGSAYEVGYQLGQAYREKIWSDFDGCIANLQEPGKLDSELGGWKISSKYTNSWPLVAPIIANGKRPLLKRIPDSALARLRGIADGAELPFLSVWLMYFTSEITPSKAERASASSGVLFAIAQERAEPDGVLVGRTLDGSASGRPMAMEVRPAEGRSYLRIGVPWLRGDFTGMNDAGLVICSTRAPELGEPDPGATSMEFLLEDILQTSTRFEEVVEALSQLVGQKGYRVIVADTPVEDVAIIEFGEEVLLRATESGVLLASAHGSGRDESARRVERLLETGNVTDVAAMKRIVTDRRQASLDAPSILNDSTQCVVVFEVKQRSAHIAFPDEMASEVSFDIVNLTRESP